MKKTLTFLAVAVCTASISQAVSVGWSGSNLSADLNGKAYMVFLDSGDTTVAKVQTALSANPADIAALAGKAFATGNVDSQKTTVSAANSGKTIEYSGSGTDTYTAFMVIFDQTDPSAGSGKYVMTGTKSISFSSNSGTKTFAFGNLSSTSPNTSYVVNVPEPTTVALLALGLAALGLKRKVA